MSSSGLIYAVIVGAWAAYLVPMWLRRQDELNEARPTERFSTAIRLLSGRAGMERRYAKDLRARSAEEEPDADAPDATTESVDVRAFAMPPARPHARATVQEREQTRPDPAREQTATAPPHEAPGPPAREQHTVQPAREQHTAHPAREQHTAQPAREQHAHDQPGRDQPLRDQPGRPARDRSGPQPRAQVAASQPESGAAAAHQRVPNARRAPSAPAATSAQAQAAAARAQRSKVLARRRRTTMMLFLAFTVGAIVAAVGGLAFLWAPGVPAVLLSTYIAHLRIQERRRFAYQMDRRRAEVAAQRLRERQPRRRAPAPHPAGPVEADPDADDRQSHEATATDTDPGLLALAADRRALVEQTDHAEWVDQQRERQRRPGHGDSWDPVPVPLPTYVTAPVAPRATAGVDLAAPDTWSSARSSAVAPEHEAAHPAREHDADHGAADAADDERTADGEADGDDERSDARRAASARRSRERGRTPLFDQYDDFDDGDRPRAANA